MASLFTKKSSKRTLFPRTRGETLTALFQTLKLVAGVHIGASQIGKEGQFPTTPFNLLPWKAVHGQTLLNKDVTLADCKTRTF